MWVGGGFCHVYVHTLISDVVQCKAISYPSPGALAECATVYPLCGHSGILLNSAELPVLLSVAVYRNKHNDIYRVPVVPFMEHIFHLPFHSSVKLFRWYFPGAKCLFWS